MESATATVPFGVPSVPSDQRQLWCNSCMASTALDATEPRAMAAEVELLTPEHDTETCQANRAKPLHARRWSRGGGEGSRSSVEGAR